MFGQDLPNSLWAKATRTVVYIQNRCLHAILENKTPEEAFTGMKPEIGHLKVFGYPVYVHIPKEKRTKMDPSEKNVSFWDIVKHLKLTESIYPVKDKFK